MTGLKLYLSVVLAGLIFGGGVSYFWNGVYKVSGEKPSVQLEGPGRNTDHGGHNTMCHSFGKAASAWALVWNEQPTLKAVKGTVEVLYEMRDNEDIAEATADRFLDALVLVWNDNLWGEPVLAKHVAIGACLPLDSSERYYDDPTGKYLQQEPINNEASP